MEDASLDEFLDGDASDDTGASSDASDPASPADPDSGRDPTADAADGAADPGPTRPAYAWTPDGAECADCGAIVERRFRDGDRLVCADCKTW